MNSDVKIDILFMSIVISCVALWILVIGFFPDVFLLILRVLVVAFLALLAFASAIGFHDNYHRNNEWPVNLLLVGGALLGAGLAVAF
ncbi:hypothetical protein EYW49_22065 [Siculibacillus lacustris]|uniref:Uncharacterized protein n=1 Tax=Siculibacillus lacustris TaxID=1549641 RepID=A0A4Q9VD05_9HYPH|nr:hypothetical protein [Siculibacillus lacustris]TBW32425.1 hypothetical protein EYW49_22065 [Siculibacillus lacustris]